VPVRLGIGAGALHQLGRLLGRPLTDVVGLGLGQPQQPLGPVAEALPAGVVVDGLSTRRGLADLQLAQGALGGTTPALLLGQLGGQ
jgi:hypothetical protein